MENNYDLEITKYYGQIIFIIMICYLLNIKFGIFCSIIFILVYLLNIHQNNYNIIINHNINNELINDPKKTEIYKQCRPATIDNPYGNYLIGENKDISVCNDNDNIKKADTFNSFNIYENASQINIGSINKMYRDFYTMPITSNINDTRTFAQTLYGNNNLSCKTDNNCLQYDDIRYHTR